MKDVFERRRACLGGIVYNEAPYLLEWIAFHMEQGFEHFYIGDHDSDDGTTALLEGLQALGYVTRLFHPRLEKADAQTRIYMQIVKATRGGRNLVAFIDADEYLVPSREDERAAFILREMLAPEEVGAVGVNWRMFGSSGRIEPGEGPLLERFTRCNRPETFRNRHVKSAVKPEHVETVSCHRATFNSKAVHYVNSEGEPKAFDQTNGFAKQIPAVEGRLRVHHYVIKSYREYIERKARRGRAPVGTATRRSRAFFHTLDRDDVDVCHRALAYLGATQARVDRLRRELDTTNYGRRLFAMHVEAAGDRVRGSFLADAALPDPALVLTAYAENGLSVEYRVPLTPVVAGAPGGAVASYAFDAAVPRPDGVNQANGVRLRLLAHEPTLLDRRQTAGVHGSIAEVIVPEDIRYIYAGAAQFLTGSRVMGWARRYDDAVPVDIEVLSADGTVVAAQRADQFRADLLLNHKHPTGFCAFDLDLADLGLPEDAQPPIRVRGSDFLLPAG